ncbi:hypothetical protein [Actinoplanes regularis]|uniref:hypothetical protein n=1 Tax=Actinoplanes regularis TaxID=52697 RepID=UPI0025547433|nr:hypothetical protein [Actinoplanes regularis]
MAFRSWVKLLATTATAAAVVGAGQLGVAYGLGIVRLDRVLDVTARDQWTAQLAWIAWITMGAAAIGATVASGLRPRWLPRPIGAGGALPVGIAAGLGALAVLPLTMQPARSAQVPGVQPVFVIGVVAGLGAAAGILAGWAAAAKPAARWNAAVLSALIWIVALVSVGPSLLHGRTPIQIRLGVLNGSLIPSAVTAHTPFLTMPTIALLAGLVIGFMARGRRLSTLASGLSGLVGPALLTVAYLIAGPEQGATGFQTNPYWSAMTACGAGVLGSVLAAIARGAPAEEDEPESTASAALPTGDSSASLPKRDAPVHSAIARAAAQHGVQPHPSDTGVIPTAAPGTPNNPFSGGTGSPFRAGAPVRPAPTPTQPPPQAPAPENPPRFSGQQPKPLSGWGARRSAQAPAPAPDSFDGFTAAQGAGRAGSITAEQPRVTAPRGPVVEPTSISGPYRSAPGRNNPGQETDRGNWVRRP